MSAQNIGKNAVIMYCSVFRTKRGCETCNAWAREWAHPTDPKVAVARWRINKETGRVTICPSRACLECGRVARSHAEIAAAE